MIGQHLGHHRITASLGAGGMGEVYRAEDTKLQREVAIKVLPADFAGEPGRLERFRREARAVAALNHPNIVTIYSVEEAETAAGRVHFLSMELVEGQTLAGLILQGPIELDRFLDIADAMTAAIVAAHEKGITHRDLKPANVMIATDGRVKVLDFGLAKLAQLDAPAGSMTEMPTATVALTQEGVVIGTMPYMSPEQVEGLPIDHRTDIFSLGILFHEMLIGTRPFEGRTAAALMSSILKDDPTPVDQARGELPQRLGVIVSRCLEKSPGDRYPTARELVNDLRDLQGGSTEHPQTVRPKPAVTRPVPSADLKLAVLPFAPDDDELAALAEGLTEDVPTGLARFSYITVADSLGSTDGSDDVKQLSRRLGARYLLRGRLRRAGAKLRCTVNLIDASTGSRLWSENYDRAFDAAGLFDLQDELTDVIVGTVADGGGVLTRSMLTTIRKRPADQLTADDWVFRAIGWIQILDSEEHAAVRAGLEAALDGEPDHAVAWGWLGIVYVSEHQHRLNVLPDSLERGHRAARKSVDLDPSCQVGWAAVAEVTFHQGDLDAFYPAADRAIELNPRETHFVGVMGMMIGQSGKWGRAWDITTQAMRVNPHHPGWLHFTLSYCHMSKDDFEAALLEAKKIQMPQLPWDPRLRACLCGLLDRKDEAATAIQALEEMGVADPKLARGEWAKWIPDPKVFGLLTDGYDRAIKLVSSD